MIRIPLPVKIDPKDSLTEHGTILSHRRNGPVVRFGLTHGDEKYQLYVTRTLTSSQKKTNRYDLVGSVLTPVRCQTLSDSEINALSQWHSTVGGVRVTTDEWLGKPAADMFGVRPGDVLIVRDSSHTVFRMIEKGKVLRVAVADDLLTLAAVVVTFGTRTPTVELVVIDL